MRKNIILIPPCYTYGDTLSVIGLFYFLLNHYDKVYLYLFEGYNNDNRDYLKLYYNTYFENEPLFNQRLFIADRPEILINNGEFGEYDICNTLTAGWDKAQFNFYDLENVDKEYYFNDLNPLYNKLTIDEKYLCNPNKHLPNTILTTNHKFYYELVGLNNNVRMDFFNYSRNYEKELEIKNTILSQSNITGDYIIINDPINTNISARINCQLPVININYLSTCVGQLSLLVEGAKEIHFVEGNNVNFFYHSQYRGIFNYASTINFHVYLRNRNWAVPNLMLDSAWKMMDEPRLNNWNFIF
jgi:hypothetical protein